MALNRRDVYVLKFKSVPGCTASLSSSGCLRFYSGCAGLQMRGPRPSPLGTPFSLSSLHPLEYQRIPDSTITQEDYRCWPSYHHGGCLLSVFNLAEAVDVCESHAQCRAFVVTNQTTWTGRKLVFFKAGWSQVVPDASKTTYVKASG